MRCIEMSGARGCDQRVGSDEDESEVGDAGGESAEEGTSVLHGGFCVSIRGAFEVFCIGCTVK